MKGSHDINRVVFTLVLRRVGPSMKWTGEHAIGTELLSGLMLWEKKKRKRQLPNREAWAVWSPDQRGALLSQK